MGIKRTEIGIIPSDWEVVRLSEIGQPIIGLTYKPSDVADSGTLVLRSSNIQKNRLAFKDNVYVKIIPPERVIVRENDLLICVRNGSKQLIGKCALIDTKTEGSAFGAFMSVFRSKDSKYIFYQFQSNVIQRQIDEVMGATINQLTNKNLNDFRIAFPSKVSERTAISNALSAFDMQLNCLEKLIAKKRDIKQATMQQLLTGKTRLPGFSSKNARMEPWEFGTKPSDWKEIKLGDCISRVIDNRGKTPPLSSQGHPLLEVNAIYKQGKSPNYGLVSKFVSDDIYNTWFRSGHPSVGDILVVTVGSAGETSYVNQKIGCIAQNIIGVGVKDTFCSEYIYYLTQTPIFKKQVAQVLMGAVQPSLKVPHLNKFRLSVPNRDEQNQISNTLDSMDKELNCLDQKLEKLRLLKQGMMQELLTGRIRLI